MHDASNKKIRCAIYTRKSCEDGLEQDFNSLHAQREAGENYIKSQAHEGWNIISTHYDDGGFSGGNTKRPALQALISDIKQQKIDIVVVYKVDRLSRSLVDFSNLMALFEKHETSFVSVTQSFNTTNSMGRLTLNMLLSFAQFEREVTSERIRDKIAASKKKGMWMGGPVPLGYKVVDRKLEIVPEDAEMVQYIFKLYHEEHRTIADITDIIVKDCALRKHAWKPTKHKITHLLRNPYYIGKVPFKGEVYDAEHDGIIEISMFEAVQEQLAKRINRRVPMLKKGKKMQKESASHKASTLIASPSVVQKECYLLRGKVFDINEALYSISTTIKHSNTPKETAMRYYRNPKHPEISFRNLRADGLEKAVLEGLHHLLQSSELQYMLVMAYPDYAAAEIEHKIQSYGDMLLPHIALNKHHQDVRLDVALIQSLLHHVILLKDQMVLKICKLQLCSHIMGDKEVTEGNAEYVTHEIPICLQQLKQSRKRIILQDSHAFANHNAAADKNKTLIRNIKHAYQWHGAMHKDDTLTITALAKKHNQSRKHVGNILQMRFLSPEITQAILAGTQPSHMTMQLLKQPFPMEWQQQAQYFGMVQNAS